MPIAGATLAFWKATAGDCFERMSRMAGDGRLPALPRFDSVAAA